MLFLSERDVEDLLDMGECIDALERAFLALARGQARNQPRLRLRLPGGSLHVMAAALIDEGLYGLKYYTAGRGHLRFRVELYDLATSRPVARLQADRLGRVRTGAASALATRQLARADAAVLAVIGSGRQAETQVEAIARVRPLGELRVYSRDPARRERFAHEVGSRLGLAAIACASAEEAVAPADVVCTATSASTPVFPGALLRRGTHVNAIGANGLERREIDDETVRRASLIVVDSRAQARLECGDLLAAVERGRLAWDEIAELSDLAASRLPPREPDWDLTLFESQGVALEDVAAAALVVHRARVLGRGREIDDDAI